MVNGPLPDCGLGHRVADFPVPRPPPLPADLTSGHQPDPEFRKTKSATAVADAAAARLAHARGGANE